MISTFAGFRSRCTMPDLVRHRHAGADVDAELHGALELDRLLVDDLAAEGVRGEVLHRDGVVALDVQEVVDADDVLVRDLARVAQLVDEALHHLLVLGDVRVQELQDQPLIDDGVLHQQHGAEGAVADAVDVLVAALDDVARLERGDVQARGSLGRLGRLLHRLVRDEQRLCRFRGGRLRRAHPGRGCGRGRRGAAGGGLGGARTAARCPRCGCPVPRPPRPPSARWSGRRMLACACSSHAHLVGALLVGQLARAPGWPRCGSRVSGRRQRAAAALDELARRRACRARAPRSAAPWRCAVLQHLHEARHGALAADLGQRIDGALAHPPVRVAGGLDQLSRPRARPWSG